MGRSRGDPDKRVRTARRRSASSTRWLERQLNDPYVREAKAAGYRSRAAFKLIELDEKFGILRGSERIVDLGIAPGGWAQCRPSYDARPSLESLGDLDSFSADFLR